MRHAEKKSTLCFSGHRFIGESEKQRLSALLLNEIEQSIQNGYDNFICGGALGFDTLAAFVVLSFKERFPHIRLVLAVPHRGQEARWHEADKTVYANILKRADDVVYISETYYAGCMQTRNRFMVDHSSALIAYCKKPTGGTVQTVSYAIKNNVAVKNLG